MLRRLHDEDTPAIVAVENNLGLCLLNQKKFAAAERAFRNTMDADERLGMSGTIEQALHTANLALALFDQGALTEAEPLFRESLELHVTLLGERHIVTATLRNNLGRCLRALERYAEARAMFEAALDVRRAHLPAEHPAVMATAVHLGVVWLELQMPENAETTLRSVLAEPVGQPATLGPGRIKARNLLADALLEQGRSAEAEKELLEILRAVRDRDSIDPSFVAAALDRLVQLYEEWGRPELADRYRQELRATTSAPADDR